MSNDLEVVPFHPTLWGKVPESLVGSVLQRLPLKSLGRFRAVSNRWNSFLVPQAARHASEASDVMLLYESYFQHGMQTKSASVIEQASCFRRSASPWEDRLVPLPAFGLRNHNAVLKACDGGLLVFMLQSNLSSGLNLQDIDKRKLLVWNPLTRENKILALPIELLSVGANCDYFGGQNIAVGLVVDGTKGNYKLVVAALLDSKQPYDKALLYDSGCSSWKETTSIPKSGSQFKTFRTCPFRSVTRDCNVYFLIGECSGITADPAEVVMKFDIEEETWSRVHQRRAACPLNLKPTCKISSETGESLYLEVTKMLRTDIGNLKELCGMSTAEIGQLMGFLEDFPQEAADSPFFSYVGFRKKNIFYHLISVWRSVSDGNDVEQSTALRLILHDITGNVHQVFHKEMPGQVFPLCHLWAFSLSLTSLV